MNISYLHLICLIELQGKGIDFAVVKKRAAHDSVTGSLIIRTSNQY